ncbi:MAG: phosphoglucosamine mutase, partial [Spirochaetales bacterium]|nr:phosphoglucosamine mutase [Spirochaetales bacterium]
YSKDRDAHEAKILVGKDTRLSCYMLEYALLSGIAASGADAYNMHVTTTPSVAYITKTQFFDCGIMISASHNPYFDNGIKLFSSLGDKMNDDFLLMVEEYIDRPDTEEDIPFATKDRIGKVIDYLDARIMYSGFLTTAVHTPLNGLKVVLDTANGASYALAPAVFKRLGANVTVINNSPDGTNINKNAGSTHIKGLVNKVLETGADVGFAYDGDGDRCIAVDKTGAIINGDRVMYIWATWLKSQGKLVTNTVVTTVMSNMGLYKALEEEGILYTQTKVGDRYVHEYMMEHGNIIGGEQSGHIIFNDYLNTGDGILTSLLLSEVMVKTGKTLSALSEKMSDYPQVLVNVIVSDKNATMEDERVKDAVKEAEKKLDGKGRVLVRASGTEPVVRVMSEAKEQKDAEEAVSEVVEKLRELGYFKGART